MPMHDWTRVDSGLFHHFHQAWTMSICDVLNDGILPEDVSALVEQRAGVVSPDVLAIDQLSKPEKDWSHRGGGGTATLPLATKTVRKSDRKRYTELANRIAIRHQLGETIAVIEVVSPGNKDGSESTREFVEKSQGYIARGIHLLVVDLFPPTKRDPDGIHQAIWRVFDRSKPKYEFPAGKDRIAASYRCGVDEYSAYVSAMAIGEALTDMPLFLDEEYHVSVPLDVAYQNAWSRCPKVFRLAIEKGMVPRRRQVD